MKQDGERVRAGEAADWLLARGRGAATLDELAGLLGVPENQVRRRLAAPVRRGEWVSPVKGLWVPVPPEYRTWGAPEGVELVDHMMGYLGVHYYVGWLSAAARWGAAHQAPQEFQVAVDRQVRDRVVGRTRFRFLQRPDRVRLPTMTQRTRYTKVVVSTPEVTAFDAATDVHVCGGIDNVATVILDLDDQDRRLDGAGLAAVAGRFPAASGRRIGHILEAYSDGARLDALREAMAGRAVQPSPLDPSGPASGPVDKNWNLILNHTLEPDV